MGDISTHKLISVFAISQMKPIIPADNLTFVEFGNFLTDVSQFRDPTAYFSAKRLLWLGAFFQAPELCGQISGFAGTDNIGKYVDELFGRPIPEKDRHGALAGFFQHLCRVFAHLKFSSSSPFPRDPVLEPMAPTEIDRVLASAYTQYYPHEHLDYPPFAKGDYPAKSRTFSRASRGLLGYLERDLQFLSEEMTAVEFAWLGARALPATDPRRQDLLVRLGHLLHAVEDFFFHSNVVELRRWSLVARANPNRSPQSSSADYRFFIDSCISELKNDANYTVYRRRFARRLRYPIYFDPFGKADEWGKDPGGYPKDVSRLAIDFAYTGAFGSDDVSHTITDGLESLEDWAQTELPGLRESVKDRLPLLYLMLSEEERRRLGSDCAALDETVKKHKGQVTSGQYAAVIDMVPGIAGVAEATDALKAAYEVDRQLQTRHPTKLGPGGFLIYWAVRSQKEADKSQGRSSELNGDINSIYAQNAENGATGETVGTHSLLAKDSPRKEPLRDESLALAKFASAAVAVTLLNRVTGAADPNLGLDWDVILRHFVRIPPGDADSWEEVVLAALGNGAQLPSPASVRDMPGSPMIPIGVAARRKEGKVRQRLEAFYRSLESQERL